MNKKFVLILIAAIVVLIGSAVIITQYYDRLSQEEDIQISPTIVAIPIPNQTDVIRMVSEMNTKENVQLITNILNGLPDSLTLGGYVLPNDVPPRLKNATTIGICIRGYGSSESCRDGDFIFLKNMGVFPRYGAQYGEYPTASSINETIFISVFDIQFAHENQKLIQSILSDQKVEGIEMSTLLLARATFDQEHGTWYKYGT